MGAPNSITKFIVPVKIACAGILSYEYLTWGSIGQLLHHDGPQAANKNDATKVDYASHQDLSISANCMKMPPIWDVYLLVIFRGPTNGSILNGLGLSSFPVALPSLEEDALGHLPAFTRKVVDCHFHQITTSILGGTEGYDHGGIALKIKQTTHETLKCSGN